MASDDDDDDVSPHVHLTIEKSKKREWLEYAEENHRGVLSDLVITAVDNEVKDKWVLASEVDESHEIEVDFSGMSEDIDDVKSRLKSLQDQIDNLAAGERSGDSLDETDLRGLANRIRDHLPEAPNEWGFRNLYDAEQTVPAPERVRLTGTVGDIADYLDEERHDVWDALLLLENKDDHVKSIIDEGTRRWYIHNPRIEIEGVDVSEEEISEDVEFTKGSMIDE